MKLSDITKQWDAIFGQNADPTTINSNGLPTNKEAFGRLCLSLGFPPECFSNPAAGGSYVWGADFNTVLNMLSKSGRIAETGTLYPFDQSYANSIGGYPVGARVDAGNGQCHVSTIDNNTTDPTNDPNGNWINPFQAIQNKIANNSASVAGLNNEIQARQNGDNNLSQQLQQEVTNRENADTNLQKQIDSKQPVGDYVSSSDNQWQYRITSISCERATNTVWANVPGDPLNMFVRLQQQITSSLLPSGWVAIPTSGTQNLIFQWCYHVAGAPTTQAFPITFPNNCLAIYASNDTQNGNQSDNAYAYVIDNGHFYVNSRGAGSDWNYSNYSSFIFAIGF